MNKNDVVKLIENKYVYYDHIKDTLQGKWNNLKDIKKEETFFEQLSLFLNNELDYHTKLIDKERYKYILPIFFVTMNEMIVVTDVLRKEGNKIKRGDILTHINNMSIADYIKNNRINHFERESILDLIRVIEDIAYCNVKKEIKLQFLNGENSEVIVCVSYQEVSRLLQKSSIQVSKINNEFLPKKVADGVCYIKLPALSDENRIKRILKEIRKNGSIYNIILDIRNNVGGKIDLAAALTGVFLKKDSEIYLKGRAGIETINIKAENNTFKYPMVVLFNNMTSSSLEYVFLESLKDQIEKKSLITVGNRTAGMKDIATVYKINERYTMVLTTKRYALPDGSYIRKDAIVPDIYIPSSANDFNVFPDKQLMGAIDAIKEYKNENSD